LGCRVVHIIGDSKQEFNSNTLVPAIMHTCKESREYGLQKYEKIGRTYICWSTDTVMFQGARTLIQFLRYWQLNSGQQEPKNVPAICTHLNQNTQSVFLAGVFEVFVCGRYKPQVHFPKMEELLVGPGGMVRTVDGEKVRYRDSGGGNISLSPTTPPSYRGVCTRGLFINFPATVPHLKTFGYVDASVDNRRLLISKENHMDAAVRQITS
jgi:hypothetical protein